MPKRQGGGRRPFSAAKNGRPQTRQRKAARLRAVFCVLRKDSQALPEMIQGAGSVWNMFRAFRRETAS